MLVGPGDADGYMNNALYRWGCRYVQLYKRQMFITIKNAGIQEVNTTEKKVCTSKLSGFFLSFAFYAICIFICCVHNLNCIMDLPKH